MSVLNPDSTEVWDDDFEFNQHNEERGHGKTRRSTASTQNNDDWDEERRASTSNAPLKDRKNVPRADTSLLHWAEPGPSTPSRKPTVQTENWDDDFQDRSDSPLYPQHESETSPRSRRSRRRVPVPETENWDDDFDAGAAHAHSPSGKSARWSSSSSDDDFGSGSREDDRTVTSRSRRATLPLHMPGDTPPPPVPSIPMSLLGTHEPSPFPRSPAASVFSVPVSSAGGHESIAYSYSSTAHLALRPTTSGSSFSGLPPSPPIHRERERRRLRKKSRPPRLDDNIYELEDRTGVDVAVSRHSMSDAESPMDVSVSLPESVVSDPHATPSTKPTGLVSRIGSVGKKWGAARKKRTSTGPGDVSVPPDTPRATAAASSPPSATASRTGWFFRHGGAGAGSGSPPAHQTALQPLKHEKSVDRLLSIVGMDPDSPSRRKRTKEKEGDLSTAADEEHVVGNGASSGAALLFGNPRRPTSMAVPNLPKSGSSRPRGPRHASYGQAPRTTSSSRSSSKQRSASASVEDLERNPSSKRTGSIVIKEHPLPDRRDRDSNKGDKVQTEGHRSFMGGVRRISLGGKHKRTQSSVPDSQPKTRPRSKERPSTSTAATAVPFIPSIPDRSDDATPRPPSRVTRPSVDDGLLPPIELQPPSPPRAPTTLSISHSEPTPSTLGIATLLTIPVAATSSTDASQSTASSTDSGQPISPTLRKLPASPQQSASLGRSSQPPKDTASGIVPRRNSLGDLKIPARISQAQVGLKRDLTMVRDFAASVEQLKNLQATYTSLIAEVQAMLLNTAPPDPAPQTRAISPTLFNIPRPGSRARSNTNPQASASTHSLSQVSHHRQMTVAFRNIMSKYHISWECAELLIELGGGPPAGESTASIPASPPATIQSMPVDPSPSSNAQTPQSRERAITLAGDEPKPHIPTPISPPIASPPHTSQWRASTGRHDLSQRQLLLLREMLNNGPDGNATTYMGLDYHIPEEEVNKAWRWGDAMSSTVTLPSEESSHRGSGTGGSGRNSPRKKRRSSRLGMRGLRDMLKSLKKSYSQQSVQSSRSTLPPPPPPPLPLPLSMPQSTTSIPTSTDSSLNLPSESHPNLSRPQSLIQRRRAKTSTGPESMKSLREHHHPNSPYGTAPPHKSSPRRPSLASIFRLNQKHKNVTTAGTSCSPANSGRELSAEDVPQTGSSSSGHVSGGTNTPEEEDWDRVDSASDLDLASRAFGIHVVDGTATLRGKKGHSPYLQQHLDKTGASGIPETPKRTPNPSQSSIFAGSSESPQKMTHPPLPSHSPSASVSAHVAQPYFRSAKLSNVKELKEAESDATPHRHERQSRRISGSSSKGKIAPSPSPNRSRDRPVSRTSRRGLQGSMRSAPPQTWMSQGHGYSPELQASGLPFNPPPPLPVEEAPSGLALSMTPENIKPLLENAREVHSKCNECIEELRVLLASRKLVD